MSSTATSHSDVHALQAPLRVAYANAPSQAAVVNLAWTEGADSANPMSGRMHFGSHAASSVVCGVHRAIGVTLALTTCQESSLQMVANELSMRLLKLRVDVRATACVCGTLGMNAQVPVGFQKMQMNVSLQPAPDTHSLRMSQMIRAAKRACMVLETLLAGMPVAAEVGLSQTPDRGAPQ